MRIFDILTVACIGTGAIIMCLAVLKTSRLRNLGAGVNIKGWTWLSRFMAIFLAGYLISITLIILGYEEPLLLLIGIVFLLGACFVFLVVSSAKSDLENIKVSNELLSKKNEELKKINKELDEFAYRTSHDLKAPVTSLKGLIHVAALSDSPDEIRKVHGMMKDRLTNLESMIRDILDLSKNSRTEMNLVTTDVYAVIQELVSHSRSHNEDGIAVTINGSRDMQVSIDLTRFKMVLRNLISNAIQYADLTKENPFVKIDYWSENGSLFVSVKDNGKGISKEYQKKVFDMFFRLEESSQGSGLGLYIVKETTEKMGGSIDVISEHGVGSEFVVSFPV